MIATAPATETNQDHLKRFMLEHGFAVGQSLPPEPQLAKQLGISRASLREAISALQSQGILVSHQGKGTFVSPFSFASVESALAFHISLQSLANPDALSHELDELVAMREMIESALVAELIGTYRQTDILALYALTTQMSQSAERGEEFIDKDQRFHDYLYQRSGNTMLLKLLDTFWAICNQVRQLNPSVEYLKANAENHRRIVDAISNQDAHAASLAMRVHFQALRLPTGNPPGEETRSRS